MERLRGLAGCIAVKHVAVVEGVRLPRPLVLGEVPAGGELRLQNLRRCVNSAEGEALLRCRDMQEEEEEEEDSPRPSSVNR